VPHLCPTRLAALLGHHQIDKILWEAKQAA
jgi:hypothetical protein